MERLRLRARRGQFETWEMLLVVAVLLALAAAVQTVRLRRAQNREHDAALRADTLAAHYDTSRAVALSRRDSLLILGDSLGAVQRRVVQVTQAPDALDRAMRTQRVLLDSLVIRVRDISTRVQSTGSVRVDTVTGARSAHFDIDERGHTDSTGRPSPPVTGAADVSLPVSGPGSLALTLTLPAVSMALRVNCGPATNGIRSAEATVTGPAWLDLQLGRVTQAPEVCNAPTGTDTRSWWRRLASRCGLDAGYGIVATGGRFSVGPAAIAGCKILP